MDLALRFEDNGTDHDDLILQFAGRTWAADSYYLALDGGIAPDREDAAKVREVLRSLLRQWLDAVESLADGGTAFLPYDFSDQYTGWLRCRRSGDQVEVRRGWAEAEGYAIYPSDVGGFFTHLPGFRADDPAVQVPLAELVQAVRASLAEVAGPG